MNRPAWKCPECGKQFKQPGQSHSCGDVSLGHHFDTRPRARELFDAFLSAVRESGGPVRLSVAKTRIGLITGMTFAAVMPRRDYLRAHVVLRRRLRSARFLRIDRFQPYWVHVFEVHEESDLDDELRDWLRESYHVGTQS